MKVIGFIINFLNMDWWIYLIIAFFAFDLMVVLWIVVSRSRKKGFSAQDEKYIRDHWRRVNGEVKSNPGKAILDADKILDFALKKKGFEGNLGEKLKKSKSLFSDLNGVWSAHKLRNRVAHELGNISTKEAGRALNQFKRGLKDLGVKL